MKRGKICVSVAASEAEAVHAAVLPILEKVDAVEIRLDAMAAPDVAQCCALIHKPLLFTHRPVWEGGAFGGFEDDRLPPLLAAVDLQAAYVDFELRADPGLRSRLLDAMQTAPTRMILSWHDFKGTPTEDELSAILSNMRASGAHIGKIVTTAHDVPDVLRLLRLQEQALAAGFPLSCFSMGSPGRISRFATLFLGGYMSYGAVSDAQATAPGQLSVDTLHTLCQALNRTQNND